MGRRDWVPRVEVLDCGETTCGSGYCDAVGVFLIYLQFLVQHRGVFFFFFFANSFLGFRVSRFR